MPTLEGPALDALQRKPVTWCSKCTRFVRPNYCRQCDVFFDAGHLSAECTGELHDAHRTY
jgi:hypothetical protein